MADFYPPPSILSPGSFVWVYVRDSGGDAQEKSIEQQKNAIKEYCERYGLILQTIFEDEAKSGGSTKGRNGFLDMLDRIDFPDLRPDGVLVWGLDRFARNPKDSEYGRAKLRYFNIVFHSMTDNIPEGKFARPFEAMQDMSNADTLEKISRDVKRGLRHNVQRGFASGGRPPRGYIREQVEDGRKRDGSLRIVSKWIPDPELWDLVKLAWRLRAAGKTYGEIIEATGGRIYKSKNCWPTFFRNKTYLGIGKCGDLELPEAHKEAVDQETWDKVQVIRKSHPRYYESAGKAHHPRRINSPYLLSGLAVWPGCLPSLWLWDDC